MFNGCNKEGGPVRGFGGGVGRETLVAPVGEEGTSLEGGCVGWGGKERGDEGCEGCEIWGRVGEGEEVCCAVEDFVVDAVGRGLELKLLSRGE